MKRYILSAAFMLLFASSPAQAYVSDINLINFEELFSIEDFISEEAGAANEKIALAEDGTSTIDVKPEKKEKRKRKDKNDDTKHVLKGGVDAAPKASHPLKLWLYNETLQGWTEGDYATGDWGGLRSKLEEHGVTLEATYLGDSFQKLYGGVRKSQYPYKAFGVVDTALILDTEKMGLWSGGTAVVRFQNKHGMGLTDKIGAYQYVNAYDDRKFAQISEYYIEQKIYKDYLKVKVGKQDACYDFMALDLATNFVNNSHAYFMPNVPLPAYPNQALGVVATINPTEWLSFRSGWYDGKAKGGTSGFDTVFSGSPVAFFIEELGIRHNFKNRPGTYLLGYWLHTGHADSISEEPVELAQTMGWYMEAEQMVWKENKEKFEDTQGLYLMGQYSWTSYDRSEIPRYYGASLFYKGLFPNRDEDVFGIGAAIAQFNERLKNISEDGRKGAETILEMFYKIQLTKWLSFQPVLQYIFRPDGGTYSNSFALGFRTVVKF